MNTLTLTAGALADRITWALVHSLWQGSAIALGLGVALFLLRRSSANVRYVAACAALALMVALPIATAILYDTPGASRAIGSSALAIEATAADASTTGSLAAKPEAADTSARWALLSLGAMRPWVFGVWLAGVLAVSLFHAFGWRQVQHLRANGASEAPPQWQRISRYLGAQLGIERAVPVLKSALVEVPTVIGWLKPVILVPAAALTGLQAEELGSILAHELAHIRRRDYLVNLIQVAAETLFFYHPAIWWASRQIRIEREHCCDDLAVEVMGSRANYARALVRLEEFRFEQSAFAMRADGGSLTHRIRRLTGGTPMRSSIDRPRLSGVLLATTLILTAAIVTVVSERSISAPPSTDTETVVLAQTSDDKAPGSYQDNESQFDEEGRWKLKGKYDYQHLQLRIGDWGDHDWSMGQRIDVEAFTGLRAGDDVQFEMRREAGTLFFQGDVDKEDRYYGGSGNFGFIINDAYVKEMKSLDVTGLDDNDLLLLAVEDVGPQFVRDLNKLGYDRVRGERLVELAIHGVTPNFIRGMHKRGYDDVKLKKFVEMRIHGVTLAFVDEMTEEGFENPTAERLVEWRIHGVSPEFVREMRDAGFDVHDSDTVVEWRIHGVTPEYIREMSELGIEPSSRRLAEMRIHGVSPEYVRELRELGYKDMSAKRMIEWRIHGVTPKLVRELKELGYDDVDSDDLVSMRIHGVTPKFIRRIQKKGVKDVSLDDLIAMKIHGIDLD